MAGSGVPASGIGRGVNEGYMSKIKKRFFCETPIHS
jgi:hypothetical protein